MSMTGGGGMSMNSTYKSNPSVLGTALFRRLQLRGNDRDLLKELGLVSRRYAARVDITQEGDQVDRTFIIDYGWASLYKILANGERQIIDFPLAGDVIGLRGAKGSAQRSFMAVTDVLVYEAPASALVATIARSEHLARFFIAEEARHKAIILEHLTNLGRRNALGRTAHLLLELGARLQAVGLADETGYDCPLTQNDLADALGLTAIHVNRMLRELREADLLSFHKGKVEFLNANALRNLSGFDQDYILAAPSD